MAIGKLSLFYRLGLAGLGGKTPCFPATLPPFDFIHRQKNDLSRIPILSSQIIRVAISPILRVMATLIQRVMRSTDDRIYP